MLRTPETALLVLSGLALIATGATGLLAPQALFTPLDLELVGASARNEIRAAYGGMHAGLGLVLLAAAFREPLRRPALWVTLAFMGGLSVGRAVSLFADGSPNAFVHRLWIPEAMAAIVAAALLASGRNPPWHESNPAS